MAFLYIMRLFSVFSKLYSRIYSNCIANTRYFDVLHQTTCFTSNLLRGIILFIIFSKGHYNASSHSTWRNLENAGR